MFLHGFLFYFLEKLELLAAKGVHHFGVYVLCFSHNILENEHLQILVPRSMVAFPDDYKTLVPKLLMETMVVVGSSFVSRINLATGEVVPETKALAKGEN